MTPARYRYSSQSDNGILLAHTSPQTRFIWQSSSIIGLGNTGGEGNRKTESRLRTKERLSNYYSSLKLSLGMESVAMRYHLTSFSSRTFNVLRAHIQLDHPIQREKTYIFYHTFREQNQGYFSYLTELKEETNPKLERSY